MLKQQMVGIAMEDSTRKVGCALHKESPPTINTEFPIPLALVAFGGQRLNRQDGPT